VKGAGDESVAMLLRGLDRRVAALDAAKLSRYVVAELTASVATEAA
jgi:hypothetical protein